MIVVSDTSAISNLYQIGQLNLLPQLFGQVLISPAIYQELATLADQKEIVDNAAWLTVHAVADEKTVASLVTTDELHRGEAEAIVLALQEKADWLIIDESAGRQTAEKYQLRIIGVLGVLIKAKQAGHIAEVRPYVEQLLQVGFRLSPHLVNRVLQSIGEANL